MTRKVATADVQDRRRPPPTAAGDTPLRIADGTVEAIKWLAVLLMTGDHVSKYLLHEGESGLFYIGRIAMPLFVFVLAYNLARPNALADGVFQRTAKRLAMFGMLACVPYIALGTVLGGWWPLNILFTLLTATAIIGLVDRGGRSRVALAIGIFVAGGALVEFWWPALALAFACWRYCKSPTPGHGLGVAVCLAALWLINRNLWAMAALPIVLAAPSVRIPIPRIPFFFYSYYPVHLALLWAAFQVLH